jgi:hypothetical protein
VTSELEEILDDLFPACAFAAFLELAHAQRGWPESETTRQRAYQLYEQALAEKNRAPKTVAPQTVSHYALDL